MQRKLHCKMLATQLPSHSLPAVWTVTICLSLGRAGFESSHRLRCALVTSACQPRKSLSVKVCAVFTAHSHVCLGEITEVETAGLLDPSHLILIKVLVVMIIG
jgi:hypothetical protein